MRVKTGKILDQASLNHLLTWQQCTDFKMFRDRRKVANKQKDARTYGTDEEVFSALPDRTSIDLQVALYFQTWETTYRILHGPSFWKEYAAFWEQKSGDPSAASFAVMLLLIVATTKCLGRRDDVFEGDTTVDRQSASNTIKVCEAWLARQPRKRLTLQFFQLQCLSLFAKRVNSDRAKQGMINFLASTDILTEP
jgi:hypothetical protein